MYTHYDAHLIANELKHLEGKSFFRPADGLFYEILMVTPAPCDEMARQKMLDIIHQLGNCPRTTESEVLGDYMMTVEGDFEILAVGATEDKGSAVFHCVPIGLIISEKGLEYEFTP